MDQQLSFRSSGAVVQQVQQPDGRVKIVVIPVNVVPVTGGDDMVARMAVGTVDRESVAPNLDRT
jgi:hypothetical protein